MDPDEALCRLRSMLREAESLASLTESSTEAILSEIIDTFDGLDSWLKRGGFLPKCWEQACQIKNGRT